MRVEVLLGVDGFAIELESDADRAILKLWAEKRWRVAGVRARPQPTTARAQPTAPESPMAKGELKHFEYTWPAGWCRT